MSDDTARKLHDRLIGAIHPPPRLLEETTSEELESVARQARTLDVPQVAGAILFLQHGERERAA